MNTLTATTTLTANTTTAPVPPAAGERSRGTVLCLIVHDELELRLRLAGLVRRAMPKIDADTVTRAGFDAISIERLRAYVAVMFIVEFSPPDASVGSLASLKRLHEQAPGLPIFVFARGGNERSAARAMKPKAWLKSLKTNFFAMASRPVTSDQPLSRASADFRASPVSFCAMV